MKTLTEAEKQIVIVKMVEHLKQFLKENDYDLEMQEIADCTTNLLQITDLVGIDKCCYNAFGDTYYHYKELLYIIKDLQQVMM